MSIPAEYRYTEDHEWICENSGVFTVGITDYAQKELGDVVFVDLPTVGKEVKRGEPVCQVESVKAVSDVYAPVDGRVTEVNPQLVDHPEFINSAPFTEGWIVRLEVLDRSQLSALLDAAAYESYVERISK